MMETLLRQRIGLGYGTTKQQVPQTMPKVSPLPPIATNTGGEETSRTPDHGQQPPP